MDNEDNVFKFPVVQVGPEETDVNTKFPVNDYMIVTVDNDEYYATGFLIFTPHHIAIMKQTPAGAIPALLLPLSSVKSAELYEDSEFDPD